MGTEKKLKDLRERYSKWEEVRRNQLSLANNLLLTFSVAILGFMANKYEHEFKSCALFTAAILILISVIAGIALVFSRLYDYKWTAYRIKTKISQIRDKKDDTDGIENLLDADKWVGRMTWTFLWFQLCFFIIGCSFLIYFVLRR